MRVDGRPCFGRCSHTPFPVYDCQISSTVTHVGIIVTCPAMTAVTVILRRFRPAPTTGPHRFCRQGATPRRLDKRGARRDCRSRKAHRSGHPGFLQTKTRGLMCTSRTLKQLLTHSKARCSEHACAPSCYDSTETWAMSSSTFTVLRNAFRAFVRALIFKTMYLRATRPTRNPGPRDDGKQPRNAMGCNVARIRCIREGCHSRCCTAGCHTRDRGETRPSTKATKSTGHYGTEQRPPTPRSATDFTRTARTSQGSSSTWTLL